ncbi:putative ATP-dependent DNA helicase RecQ [Blattamonas nauphoetae]|uniref:ATP-dependent DNA helicase n=1 Tax=Blattamonas nauphoetae TaxID=2049346 RepID=A0ABQ9Y9A8_9EUKA|nr:putative ATP-dependent DNA helicase RecQ [Blattamonas nauphoetae]
MTHSFRTEELTSCLQRFGLHQFRGQQLECIQHVLDGNDAFVLWPTGAGKSLVYQLPPLVTGKLSIVVSPLIALMMDQASSLQARGIRADILADLGSKTPQLKLLFVTPEMIITEKFQTILSQLVKSDLVGLFAIDEAHMISQWGHQFRPNYKQLGILRDKFPMVPIVALTATAIPEVRTEVIESLHMFKAKRFISSFDRKNIFYSIIYKELLKNPEEDLLSFVKMVLPHSYDESKINIEDIQRTSRVILASTTAPKIPQHSFRSQVPPFKPPSAFAGFTASQLPIHSSSPIPRPPSSTKLVQPTLNFTARTSPMTSTSPSTPHQPASSTSSPAQSSSAQTSQPLPHGSGIIYCRTREQTDSISRYLACHGIKAKPYHAKMKNSEREQVRTEWVNGVISVVVGTVALGMGIDKPDVRFVVHCDVCSSLEEFYQESGRAGRDGLPAWSVMYYSKEEAGKLLYLLKQERDQDESSLMIKRQDAPIPGTESPLDLINRRFDVNVKKLHKMIEYCETTKCRRSVLLDYLGENRVGERDSSPSHKMKQSGTGQATQQPVQISSSPLMKPVILKASSSPSSSPNPPSIRRPFRPPQQIQPSKSTLATPTSTLAPISTSPKDVGCGGCDACCSPNDLAIKHSRLSRVKTSIPAATHLPDYTGVGRNNETLKQKRKEFRQKEWRRKTNKRNLGLESDSDDEAINILSDTEVSGDDNSDSDSRKYAAQMLGGFDFGDEDMEAETERNRLNGLIEKHKRTHSTSSTVFRRSSEAIRRPTTGFTKASLHNFGTFTDASSGATIKTETQPSRTLSAEDRELIRFSDQVARNEMVGNFRRPTLPASLQPKQATTPKSPQKPKSSPKKQPSPYVSVLSLLDEPCGTKSFKRSETD